jgi:hypothetical protein
MAALTAPRNTSLRGGFIYRLTIPVAASVTIYKGAMVCLNSTGYAEPGVAGTSLIAAGVADQTVTNGSTAGAVSVDVLTSCAALVNVTGSFTQTDNLKTSYYSDDNTVTRTPTGSSAAGTIVEFVSATSAWVYFDVPTPALVA